MRIVISFATTRGCDELAHLLHDPGLPLGEGDMTARLVRDELDLNLSPLTTGLVIIIVIIVSSGWALTLGTATVSGN